MFEFCIRRCIGLAIATGLILSDGNHLLAADIFDETQLETLFSFDQVSIPYTQNLRLKMRSPTRHPQNPVLSRGKPGSPDAMGVQFYGSIIREGDRYRMWYVAYDDDDQNKVATSRWRAAYAESRDGLHWTKPDLGLVEYHGNKNNNLILTDPSPFGFVNLKVLYEPDASIPEHRYKISTHVYFRHHTRLGTLAPFASADGFRWKLLTDAKPVKAELQESDLVIPGFHFEPCGGLYKWDGMYYACGQNAMQATMPIQGRVIRMHRSPDFIQWSATNSIGFVRSTQREYLGPGRSLEGEQTHEGISVWNRRNVLLGIYGQWHGAKEWKDITVDLGLVFSNDGVNFREPSHEWVFLKRGEDNAWDQGGLLQGQGFENIGDQTFVYYGAWDPRTRGAARGGVGIAVLPRDRFADLLVDVTAKGPGDYQQPHITSEFITANLIRGDKPSRRFYMNADGLGPEAKLRVELLDEKEQAIPTYAGKNAATVETNGFHTAIAWNNVADVKNLPDRFRMRVIFEGEQNTHIRFNAIYCD
jgi:hypothetical protein